MLHFIYNPAENPNTRGDFQDKDDAGHEIQVKIIGDFAISFWANHAVREIKVINIQAADAPWRSAK